MAARGPPPRWTAPPVPPHDVRRMKFAAVSTESQVDAMQVTRQHVVDILRTAGHWQTADEAALSLPELMEFERAASFLARHGITKSELISRMGGSP